jgi:hypothetical protein
MSTSQSTMSLQLHPFTSSDEVDIHDVKLPSLVPSTSSSAPPALPFDITATSDHQFVKYEDLVNYVTQHAAARGFKVKWRPTGSEEKAAHGGTVHCWNRAVPPSSDEPAAAPSFPPARKRCMTVAAKASKQQKTDCGWRVCFFRRQASGGAPQQYALTTRLLTHNHSLLSAAEMNKVDSLRDVSPEMERAVRAMAINGIRNMANARRYLEDMLGVNIDRDVFHNLVGKTKRELGMVDNVDDFRQLLAWLQEEQRNRTAVARYHVDEEVGYEVDGVFYMSSDMAYHLDRNGVMLVMDTTFKTNRFHWPLLIVCGINEHWQTVVLAVALLHHQTTVAFSWALEQMRSAVSAEAWASIAAIITDGDDAMAAAITAQLPEAAHLRCRFHLEMNLRHNLRQPLGEEIDQFISRWKALIDMADG